MASNRRPQAGKAYGKRNFVAIDAGGYTDGNRRKTRFDNDSKRMGTKRAIIAAAMAE